jgi:hypothetical protein
VNGEFNWWLLIVGLVLGAALTWLVMADTTRREVDITETEQRGESLWIARILSATGREVAPERVEEILRLHREYLSAPPPDEPEPEPEPEQEPVRRSEAAAEPADEPFRAKPRADDAQS